MRVILSTIAIFSLVGFLHAETPAPTAEQLMTAAETKAAAEHKTIFVHFGASWCGWCKRLDAFLDKPNIKPVFEKYFVPVKLVVNESEKDKALDNAGADDLFKKFGGPSGIPFSAFLDAKGELIINSDYEGHKGENIGYPGEPKEIDWFIVMMKKASPNMSADDLKTIETELRSFKRS